MLDRLGSISGMVSDAVTGDGIPFAGIQVFPEASGFSEFTIADETGRYSVGGLVAGNYFVVTDIQGTYSNEVYDNIPCPSGSCDPTSGMPVAVQLNNDTPDIDFALDRLGSISGRVTNELGQSLPFVDVTAGRSFLHIATTDAQGNYRIEGLGAGDWLVRTHERDLHRDELYDNIPCPFDDCDYSLGTPVPVTFGADTPEIDFALAGLGSISGVVRDSLTSAPLANYRVRATEPTRGGFRSTTTDDQGRYTLTGLDTGSYSVSTDERGTAYRDEIYDNVPCFDASCDGRAGTLVFLELGGTVDGIDFDLDPFGSISGQVTDARTGEPLGGVFIEVFDSENFFLHQGTTDTSGNFEVIGLAAGTYFVSAHTLTHAPIVYDGIPCQSFCDPSQGTPVEVEIGAETSGVDMAMTRLGAIAGRVTDAETGDDVDSYDVTVQSLDHQFSASAFGVSGAFRIENLPAGTYYVTVFAGFEYVNEHYRDTYCVGDGCNQGGGTPVDVSLDSTTAGIDFTLDRSALMTGTVISPDMPLGVPAVVSLWAANGQLLDTASTTILGERYYFTRLPAGTYFVSVEAFGYEDLIYDGFPCRPGDCDVLAGTPIVLATGDMAEDINFVLEPTVEPDCVPSATTLCLNRGRFQVEIDWRDGRGNNGSGTGVVMTSDTGYFWFFDLRNVEVVVKVLDACRDFDRFWVFAAGLTDVEAVLTVTDTVTNQVRTYTNPLGTTFQPVQDTDAFMTCSENAEGFESGPREEPLQQLEELLQQLEGARTASTPTVKAPVPCVEGPTTLCLNEGRFEVQASWESPAPASGDGQARLLTADTGYFWFFDPDNVEAVVKVLDACTLDGFNNYWVFAAGLTDVRVTLTVTDTLTGERQQWINPLGNAFQPIAETGSFNNCP